jgi:hypothetical protein
LADCTWTGAVGTVVGLIGAAIGISGFLEKRKYQRLNMPRVEIAHHGAGRGSDHQRVTFKIANDDGGLYRIASVTVVSPSHARVSLFNGEEIKDEFGSAAGNMPGQWLRHIGEPGDVTIIAVKPRDCDVTLEHAYYGRQKRSGHC